MNDSDQVEMITDQPEHSGAGVYAWNLYRQLKEMVPVKMAYYNHQKSCCELYGAKGLESTVPVGIKGPKPFFWWQCIWSNKFDNLL